MRHVPDEELHPYLDQALSRSQCVEIETHLAQCGHCRDRRDEIAALRDRTTALLGLLTPRQLIVPPPFEALAERLSREPVPPLWQIRLRRASLWAAGVMAAVGAGWVGRSVLDPHEGAPPSVDSTFTRLANTAVPAPVPTLDPSPAQAELAPAPRRLAVPDARPAGPPAPRTSGVRLTSLVSAPATFPQALSINSDIGLPEGGRVVNPVVSTIAPSSFGPLWQGVQWEDALERVGSGLPYVEGLLVVGVLLHPGEPGERPTAIVAQQDPGGEMIFSIEGPPAKVDQVMKQQGTQLHSSELTRTTPDYVSVSGGGMRRVNRVLRVTGRMSVDSLNVLARLATIR